MIAGPCAKPSCSSQGRWEPAGSHLFSWWCVLFPSVLPTASSSVGRATGVIVGHQPQGWQQWGPTHAASQGCSCARSTLIQISLRHPLHTSILAPVPPVIASWLPPWLLSSGVLLAEPPPPTQCSDLLHSCWQGPPGREGGDSLYPCSILFHDRAIVPGWEEGVGLLSIYRLTPCVHLK